MSAALVILIVSGSLLLGAAWGLYGRASVRVDGFLIALAGGALLLTLVTDMVQPAAERTSVGFAMAALAVGAITFTAIDWLVDERWGPGSGFGLLLAITLDGIPENLALGVGLVDASPTAVAALAVAIFLSNLPEAAGATRDMARGGRRPARIMAIWITVAAALAAAAFAGNRLVPGASVETVAFVRCFAAGAVVASLATEVFPKAYREGHHLAGIATALGLILAFVLGELARG
jgi:ZIP family zinc transporter